jgi:hypothetical protein
LRRSQLWLACTAAILVGLVALNAARSSRISSDHPDNSALALKNLALLEPKRLLAKVGDVELSSEDLREALQTEFQGHLSHAGLSPEDLGSKAGQALDVLIQDELLAQAGRQAGLRTHLKGSAGRKELARQHLAQNLAKVPPVAEVELRNFYKNHGEKFIIPPSVQLRELFLPLQSARDKRSQSKDQAFVLGQELAARIRKGESAESLAVQHVPGEYRDRAQVHEFRGADMESEDERKVLALKPGEVAGPLRIEGGYSVFQGVALVRSGRIPFYEAREKIKTYLENQRVEEARQRLVADLQRLKPVQRFAPDKTVAGVQ